MKNILFSVLFAFLALPAQADTITLKNGEVLTGTLIEQADDYIRIDEGYGLPLTYYIDQIEHINQDDQSKASGSKDFSQNEKKEIIHQLFKVSGIDDQFEQFEALVFSGFESAIQQYPHISKDKIQTFQKILLENYASAIIKKDFEGYFKASFKEEDARNVIAWYETELGQKVLQLDIAGSTPAAQEDLMQFVATDMINTSPQRLAMAEEFDQLTQATKRTMNMIENMSKAVAIGFQKVNPQDNFSMKEIEMQMTMMRTQLKNQYKQMTLGSFIYFYEELSDEEYQRYLDFLHTDSGKAFYQAVFEAFDQAFSKASRNLGKDVGISLIDDAEGVLE